MRQYAADGQLSIFNTRTLQTTAGAALRDARRDKAASVALSSTQLLSCGGGPTVHATCEAYNTAADTWTNVSSLPDARVALAMCAEGGRAYALGGWNAAVAPTDTNYMYAPLADAWTVRAPLPAVRAGAACAAHADGVRLLLCGGMNASAHVVADCHVYNTTDDTWAPAPAMRAARTTFAMVVVNGGWCHVIAAKTHV